MDLIQIEESIKNSVKVIKNHPLMPEGVVVHGVEISLETGKFDVIVNGYEK